MQKVAMSQITSSASAAKLAERQRFWSLRWKLLTGFTLVFSTVFAVVYWWFYNFSTEKAIARLKQDLESTAIGTAHDIDAEELLALYKTGERNAEGFSDDPRYLHQLEWFETAHRISPNVYAYSFILGKPSENRRIGKPATTGDELEAIYLVDSLWRFLPERALPFLEPDKPSPYSLRAFQEGETVNRDLYTDQWGSWISAYTPIRDKNGKIVAVLGADIEADHVFEVQQQLRDRLLLSFLATYGTLFSLVYLLSGILSRPLKELSAAAERIGEGDYSQDLTALSKSEVQDEISTLARVFQLMVDKVRQREESLKQQVASLKIEIDQVKRQKQVQEIVETDFFQDLVVKARKLRNRPMEE
ncbi:HAMP domain-containing protein [Thermoleptolyngbya oregonensis NK1-22]|uniref:histidine kinase n=1 Tax=Thermoleptolyngbya oregonensis NK1-22 TaxID=2547457 RepID=A0AA96Y8V2_9CYAN|nr:HAMP domain-containing protein [Thermoleptolyngbya sp. PKUAC-SCTB121]WOB42185.1 HAMP domain-containing protein [Thermoleptolyngbya oregonensis NK1-22]